MIFKIEIKCRELYKLIGKLTEQDINYECVKKEDKIITIICSFNDYTESIKFIIKFISSKEWANQVILRSWNETS